MLTRLGKIASVNSAPWCLRQSRVKAAEPEPGKRPAAYQATCQSSQPDPFVTFRRVQLTSTMVVISIPPIVITSPWASAHAARSGAEERFAEARGAAVRCPIDSAPAREASSAIVPTEKVCEGWSGLAQAIWKEGTAVARRHAV